MRFYTASKLGSKRAYTPEGFLVCLDVPIARTGEMIYAGTELPELEAGPDGLIRVIREPIEVFKPESMASFVGKPTTNDHPPEMVGTANYRRFTAGSTQNVRQGNAGQDDLVFADLMFCEPSTIAAIEGGKDEISNGYDAEYEMIKPGVYRQVEITGNHVAVVAEGRCGPRCAIGDSAAPNVAVGAQGAGVALRAPTGNVLFLKRGEQSDHPGTWCFPGGGVEPGEAQSESARRELKEETGLTVGDLRPLDARGGFVTFRGETSGESAPRLNAEHTDFAWAPPDAPPQPLHPGVAATLGEKADALKNSAEPATPARDTKSAPSCGCGGHTHDAKPAPTRKRKTRDMTAKTARPKLKGTMMDKLRRAFSAKDEAGFEEVMNEVESTTEEQEQADLADMIGQSVAAAVGPAIASAIEPLTARLDDVDAFVTDARAKDAKATKDRKTKDDASLGNPDPDGSNDPGTNGTNTYTSPSAAAQGSTGPGTGTADPDDGSTRSVGAADSDAVGGFLKGKGLSAEDIEQVMALLKKDEPVKTTDETLTEERKAELERKKAGTTDSVSLTAEFRDTVAKAEILAPGVRLPSFDAKAKPVSTNDAMCGLRRRALQSAFDSAERKLHVAPFVDAKPDFKTMTCDAIKTVFAGASELAKRANAPSFTTDAGPLKARNAGTRDSIAEMNAAAAQLWKPTR